MVSLGWLFVKLESGEGDFEMLIIGVGSMVEGLGQRGKCRKMEHRDKQILQTSLLSGQSHTLTPHAKPQWKSLVGGWGLWVGPGQSGLVLATWCDMVLVLAAFFQKHSSQLGLLPIQETQAVAES